MGMADLLLCPEFRLGKSVVTLCSLLNTSLLLCFPAVFSKLEFMYLGQFWHHPGWREGLLFGMPLSPMFQYMKVTFFFF